jgi:hypothetical protein
MKRLLSVILLCSAFLIAANAQEYRVGLSTDLKITSRLKAEGEAELRWMNHPEPYFNRTFQLGVKYAITGNLNADVVYSASFIDKIDRLADADEENETAEKRKISFDLQYQSKRLPNDLRFTHRLRFQQSVFLQEDEPHQYLRNKFTMDYKLTYKLNPYLSVEPYFLLNERRFKAMRVYIGNEIAIWKTKLDLYYIAEIRFRPGNTGAQYIVGATVELNFNKNKK